MPHYPNPFSSKLPETGTSIFTIMSQLANQYKAINLSQGFPNFECSAELIKLVNNYMKKGFNQYAPMQGIMSLRETIAEKMEETYAVKYSPENEITITSGGTQAIYAAITSVIKEGDEVILFEPAYDSYVPAIKLNGGIPLYIQLNAPNYNINWDEVKKLISQKTKMIMINTPHNPTGSVLSSSDIDQLEKIVENTDIIVLSDEVYEHIIFDGHKHQSLASFPKLAERSFIIFSFGKTFHATGWKMGYCLAPENLMEEFRKVHQFMVFCANTPIQHALAEYMRNREVYEGLHHFYQKKRDRFINLIKGSKFKFAPTSGSYFQLLNYTEISNEKDTDFAVRLTKEIGVAAIPISVFYHKPVDNNYLRFCFAKTDETLEMAAEKLCAI